MMVQNRRILSVSPGVFRIQVPMFPVYLLRFERPVMIDSGITTGVSAIRTAMEELLHPDSLDALLLTHSHWDHAGGVFELQPGHDFKVLASERAVELLQKPRVRTFIHHLNSEHAVQHDTSPPEPYEPLRNLEPLAEKDRVDLGGEHWLEVFETPGHTRCSLAFLLHPERILFPGDAVGVTERDGSIKPLFLSDYGAYERSIMKLQRLEARALCFAHNHVLSGEDKVREFLAVSLSRTRQVRDRIAGLLASGKGREDIAEDLFAEEFPHPTVMGPREALIINFRAMVLAVEKETA